MAAVLSLPCPYVARIRLRGHVYRGHAQGVTTFYLVELGTRMTLFPFTHAFETGSVRSFPDFLLEFNSSLILVGCVTAILRRFFLRPGELRTEEEDITSLLFILFLELSGFFIEGYRIAYPGATSYPHS